jgi:hypothetical protein
MKSDITVEHSELRAALFMVFALGFLAGCIIHAIVYQ